MMTRAEHLAWCKKRALEYLDSGDKTNAVTSMLSDLRKHPETEDSGTGMLAQLGMMEMMQGTQESVRRYITGFN